MDNVESRGGIDMSSQKSVEIVPPNSKENDSGSHKTQLAIQAKWTAIGVIVTAIFGAVGLIGASYFNYLEVVTPDRIEAPDISSPTVSRESEQKLILSQYAEVFDFDGGDTEGWKPLVLDSAWVDFKKSGNIDVVDSNFEIGGHKGPFLKYPLDLEATHSYASLKRNAIYKPVDDIIIGVMANVYYKSKPGYEREEIHAGFIVPYEIGDTELQNEDFMKPLIPNTWNTIIWSMYGPIWWGSEDKNKEWITLKELFGGEDFNLQVGRHFHNERIEKIGIQFLVSSEGDPEEFQGTVYFDNIIFIYKHP